MLSMNYNEMISTLHMNYEFLGQESNCGTDGTL